MAFFLLSLTIFIMFFQIVYIFPLLEAYQPLRNSALIALVAFVLSKTKSTKPFWANKTNVFFVLFICMQVISSSQIWLTGAWETLNSWLKMLIIYYLIVKSAVSESRIKVLILMIVCGLLYLSYYSISTFIINYMPGTRASGFGWYDGSNDLAIILVTAIPLASILAFTFRSKIQGIIPFFIAIIFAFNILFTGSRNGLIGLSIVSILIILMYPKMSFFIKIILTLLLLFSIIGTGLSIVKQRGDLLTDRLRGDRSSEDRIDQWKSGLSMIKRNALLGVGPDQFGERIQDYGGEHGMAAHNTILQVFAETGIPGGLFFLIFILSPIIEFKKISKYSNRKNNINNSVFIFKFISIALLGFVVCSIFSNRVQFYILYVLIALLVAINENLLNHNYK